MEKSSRKKNLFSQEAQILKDARKVLDEEGVTEEILRQKLSEFTNSYEELLDQSKLITKVSDRLQKKINKANDELEQQKMALEDTLETLNRAKVSRKATTITLVIFIVLFLVAEWGVEPHIDEYAMTHFKGYWTVLGVQLGSKAILALMLKPIEMVVEKILMRQAEREIKKQREEEQKQHGGIPKELLNK